MTTWLTMAACLRLFLADRGMARDHVAHLMRQHRGELGLVVGERDQPARDVELAVRQREGVDRRRIEDGDLVFQIGPLGRRHQPVDGLLDRRLQARVLVGAAIGGEDARMLALAPPAAARPARRLAAPAARPGGCPACWCRRPAAAQARARRAHAARPASILLVMTSVRDSCI